ncbi:MAG: peptidoglycan DD-metalloendopeptidase family protein, partial [Candidatus Eremiobacteraeota bacterium]|nr:peptidoglycan DD-metalloendopeptidase family protein [Candidatus Eremiobacteraeota bacterium]
FAIALGVLLSTTGAWADSGQTTRPVVVERMVKMYGPAQPPAALFPTLQKDPLGHLLALQRKNWGAAWISSTFYDWRTVSQYRRNAGLHLGYDIALPFGTPVSAGWGGTVVAVVPWTASEWGVTVRGPDGTEVTYGHISPSVVHGQQVNTGDTVGRIAADHVDVKMRDSQGNYVPFGEGTVAIPVVAQPAVSRNSILTSWLVAKSSLQQAEEDLFLARNAGQKWALEKRSAERQLAVLDRTLEHLNSAQSEGLVSRRRLEELKAERAQAQKALTAVSGKEKATPTQLEQNVRTSRANLEAMESWAKLKGLKWQDVESLIQKTLAGDSKLREKAGQTDTVQTTMEQLAAQKKKGAERLKNLEELYLAGGISTQEIEDERLRQKLLEEEYNLRERRKNR